MSLTVYNVIYCNIMYIDAVHSVRHYNNGAPYDYLKERIIAQPHRTHERPRRAVIFLSVYSRSLCFDSRGIIFFRVISITVF